MDESLWKYMGAETYFLTKLFSQEVKDYHRRANFTAQNYYTVACKELGIVNPKKLVLNFMLSNLDEGFPAGLCFYNHSVDKQSILSIGINLGYVLKLTRKIFDDTIIHEVAHAIAYQIDVDLALQDGHHGKLWRDVTEYLGIKPNVCFSAAMTDVRMVLEFCEKEFGFVAKGF